MTESQEILIQHFPLLRQYLQCEAVFPYLVQKKLLTQAQQSELTLLTLGPYEKVDRLLLYLPRSRPDFLELFIDCLRESADGTNHEELANKLEKAMANGTLPGERDLPQLKCADQVTEVEKDQGSGSEDSEEISDGSGQSVLEQPLILTTRNPEPEPSQNWWRKNWKYLLISTICLVTSGTLIFGAFLGASIGPGVHDYNIGIHRNDTIVVPIRPSSQIVHKLGLQTYPLEACNGLALLLPCSGLQTQYIANVPLRFFTDRTEFIYMLTGSTVHFFLRDERSSVNVWIFDDFGIYTRYTDDLDHLDCSPASSPKGSHCIPLNLSSPAANFTIRNTSYYFFSCSPDYVICLGNLDWTIDLYWYNYMDYLDTAELHNVSSGSPTEIVVHRKNFDVSFSREVRMCLLLHINYNSMAPEQTCPSQHSTLYVRGIEINQVVWLFASFSIIVAIVVIVVGLCCCCCWHHRCTKRRSRGPQESLYIMPERTME